MNPIISVIIPIFNVEKYIEDCLESVVNQTYRNLQIILVDDGSTDNCGEICDKYATLDNRVSVIHKHNAGHASALNTGFEMVKGKWLYFLDSDDWLDINAFDDLMKKAGETKADLIYFDYRKIFTNGKTKRYNILPTAEQYYHDTQNYNTFRNYYWGNGAVWNFIIKTELILNKVRFRTGLRAGYDSFFKLECYRFISSYAYLNKSLHNYRIVKTSITNTYRDFYTDAVLGLYNASCSLVKEVGYPKASEKVINTRLINYLLPAMCVNIFDKRNNISLPQKVKQVKSVLSSAEVIGALSNFDKFSLLRRSKLYIVCGKPSWIILYIMCHARRILR